MTEQDELLQSVRFGIEVETFLNTPIGKYLVERARGELEAARDALEKINPVDVVQVRQEQLKAYQARNFESWLAEAIQDGWNSEGQLKALDEAHGY
jgi:hypothetical protein